MLRPRGLDSAEPSPVQLRPRRDPLAAITVLGLSLIALGLFIAAVLAVYTYSTPDVELPLVIAITFVFVAVLAVNLLGLALRQLRAGRW